MSGIRRQETLCLNNFSLCRSNSSIGNQDAHSGTWAAYELLGESDQSLAEHNKYGASNEYWHPHSRDTGVTQLLNDARDAVKQ
jgi:hypothetical protein